MRMKTKTGIAVAAIGALSIVGAAPAQASEVPAGPCQFLMPISPGDVTYCACVKVATVGQVVLPGSQWACTPP